MKRQIAMIALLFLGMGMTASAQFGKKFNVGKALQAGKDVVSAVTLSDADIANMSKEYMVWMDAHNPLTKPDTEYVSVSLTSRASATVLAIVLFPRPFVWP